MSYTCPACDEPLPLDATECEACGLVIESTTFSSDQPFVVPDSSNFTNVRSGQLVSHLNRHLYPCIPVGKKSGRKLIDLIAQRLKFGEQLTESAKELYDRVFDHDRFRKRILKKKLILAAASVYVRCRELERIVTIGDIADISQCTTHDIDRCKREIMDAFNINIQSVDILELAEKRCLNLELGNEITSSTIQVIKLCQELWISDGKNPENVILAATFLAWQGEKPIERFKSNFRAFCKLFKLVYTNPANRFVGLIRLFMCELSKAIPWIASGSIQPDQVAFHVKDIIKFQSCLLAEVRTKYSASEPEDISDGEDPRSKETGCDKLDFVNCDNRDVKAPILELPSCPSSSKTLQDSLNATNSGQLTSLKRKADDSWPPYLLQKCQRRKPQNTVDNEIVNTMHNLDKEELGMEDIPDKDLHLFIKSGEEIKAELCLANMS